MNKLPKLPDNFPIAPHFVNAVAKAKFLAGDMNRDEFKSLTKNVELKKGIDNKTRRQLINNLRYARKMTSEEWTKKADEIKAAK